MKSTDGYMVYWEDEEYDRIVKTEFSHKPFQYTINPVAKWKPVVADEDRELKAGVPEIIRIRKVSLPRNTMCSPLKVMRNGLGAFLSFFLTGAPRCIEDEKEFNRIVFLPIFDGKVKKGDLLGILLVYFVNAGMLGGPEVSTGGEEEEDVCFVYWKDGELVRENVMIASSSYFQSFVYEWMPIISAEDVRVKKGKLEIIRTESFEVPGNAVLDSLFVMRNAMGDVVDVFRRGKPRKIESTRKISRVVFLPTRDGVIEKGDLLNVAALHHVIVDEPAFQPAKAKARAKLVYLEDGKICREEVELDHYGHYEGTSKGRWEVLVSEETKTVRKGKVSSIKIKDVVLDPGTVVSPLCGMIYALGVLLDVCGTGKVRKIEKRQRISHALFFPVFDGKVKEGEIVGILKVHSAEVRSGDKLMKMLEKLVDKLSMSSGRFAESTEWPHLWHKSYART